jgi:hypothetical protein
MHSLSQNSAPPAALPDPSRVWWRARISKNQARAEKTREYFEWAEWTLSVIFAAAAAAWIFRHGPALQFLLARTIVTTFPHPWFAAAPLLVLGSALLPLAALLVSLAAAALVYPILVRD